MIKATLSTLFVLYISSVPVKQAFRIQNVAVKGHFLCGGEPLVGAKVALYDVDRNPGDADDLLDAATTNAAGKFLLSGSTRELTTIEPELRVLHDCNDDIRPCRRQLVLRIPLDFIYTGFDRRIYDVGTMDLWERDEGEQRVC